MIDKIIIACFSLLFLITPLIWIPSSYELFEYNKMMFVYFLTTVITGFWLINMISTKSLIFKKTPLDIPIALFLISNILSTIFSIDPHVSIWGYYSRSNGGLLSTISYITLYYAFVSNFEVKQAVRFLKISLLGGFLVALYAIPEHFGVSPSCVLLNTGNYWTGKPGGFFFPDVINVIFSHPDLIFNVGCWQQDVQARVFATLGQPNWLAAYLELLVFPAAYFLLTSKKLVTGIIYLTYILAYYLAITFTDSRSATLGLIGGMLAFVLLQAIQISKTGVIPIKFSSLFNWRLQAIILMTFLIINLIFGSAFTRFKLYFESQSVPTPSKATTTQLESGGTESGQIRWIVWQGALDIFKHYPVLGSGVETFAYSYYQYRPVSHNLVSEWDFLYNKAHNEYLNYLATTGAVGYISYMIIIFTFLFWSVFSILSFTADKKQDKLLISTLTASYVTYLIQNIFSFSVVLTSMFFFLLPAFTFTLTESTHSIKTNKFFSSLQRLIYRRTLYPKILLAIVSLLMIYLLNTLVRFYAADYIFAAGNRASDDGNVGKAYNELTIAHSGMILNLLGMKFRIVLNPQEPFYQSELAYAAAAASVAIAPDDLPLSTSLKDQAISETQMVLSAHPKNISWYRTAIRTYAVLAESDPTYYQQTLSLLDQSIALAPTDPRLTYNKSVVLSQQEKVDEAISWMEKTVELKPNYRDAHYALGLLYFTKSLDKNVALNDQKQFKQKAIDEMNVVLKLIPNDPQAVEKLQDWQKK